MRQVLFGMGITLVIVGSIPLDWFNFLLVWGGLFLIGVGLGDDK